jgi:hypothetical protein
MQLAECDIPINNFNSIISENSLEPMYQNDLRINYLIASRMTNIYTH